MSGVDMSGVRCHMSRVTCHMSHMLEKVVELVGGGSVIKGLTAGEWLAVQYSQWIFNQTDIYNTWGPYPKCLKRQTSSSWAVFGVHLRNTEKKTHTNRCHDRICFDWVMVSGALQKPLNWTSRRRPKTAAINPLCQNVDNLKFAQNYQSLYFGYMWYKVEL